MVPDELRTALKEWAVVQRSLREGHQIILLRKGGLIEETGDFDLRSHWFWIFPTYAHEAERSGDVQPCFNQWLLEEEARQPPRDTLRLEMIAQVTDCIKVEDRQKLLALAPQHIWSPQFIHGRYDWEPYKPVFVLLLRAYTLPKPISLPMQPDFGGCRSWIDLPEAVSTTKALPVLPDEHYQRRRALTLRMLAT
jgi:hypothetical protein